jgi:preprotein translocase subunit SecE
LGKEAIVNKKNEAEIQKPTAGFNVANFVRGTKEELDKVVWPSRQQLVSESLAVLSMVVLSATLIYLIDGLFAWAAKQVF